MKNPKDWSVYLVRCSDASLYTGIAKDVAARVLAHNQGKGAAYTRSRRPVDLVYHKPGLTRSAALIEEARIKSLERADKLAFLKKAVKKAARAIGAALLLWAASPASALPTFVKETGISIASATPQAFTGESAVVAGAYTSLRMYYLLALSSGAPHTSSGTAILSATSTDGVAWTKEAGIRVDTNTLPSVSASSITGAAIGALTGGGFRMLYSIVSTTGAFRIHSATSADGLAWANETPVVVDGGSTTYVGVPRVVVLNSGNWRLYYTRDNNGGDQAADRQIFSALSTDQGVTWGASSVVIATTAYESGAAKLTDGRVRLYYTQPPINASSATVILSAISPDALGASFTAESGTALSTPVVTGALSFPVPVRATDTFRWRLYHTFYEAYNSTGDVRSALTSPPDPLRVSPNTVFQNAGSIPLTVTGEVFSPVAGAHAVSISRNGVTLVGTSVSRTDDQTLSASFATNGQALGVWDLTLTNSDGTSTTLSSALTIDFAPGTVALRGNLLRPREGTPTTVDVTIFAAGRVSLRVYDADGRPVRTLYEADQNAGAFTVRWDGKDASGGALPSGLYFISVNGPKLSAKSKVVLIR